MTRRDWWRPDDALGCGLLVSVRDAGEAAEAIGGGATIIDVKEPDRGPLGRADAPVIAAVGRIASLARRPWTIAAGELRDGPDAIRAAIGDVLDHLPAAASRPAAIKVGLAGMAGQPDAIAAGLAAVAAACGAGTDLVAVAYLDWGRAAGPEPGAVIAAAADQRCRAVLFDTFDKAGPGGLAGPWAARLAVWFAAARSAGLAVALAGRIDAAAVPGARGLRPDVLGFRSAACDGGRFGRVSGKLVARLGTLCRPTAAVTGG